jgi:hypothetical protein
MLKMNGSLLRGFVFRNFIYDELQCSISAFYFLTVQYRFLPARRIPASSLRLSLPALLRSYYCLTITLPVACEQWEPGGNALRERYPTATEGLQAT